MNYADLKKTDIANGPGVRASLFVSGCTHGCPGCFNPETWDFQYGKPFTRETLDELLSALAPSHIRGLSLLGGEPFHPDNQPQVLEVVRKVRETLPDKNVWCYTGYLFEELAQGRVGDPDTARALLSGIDVLVDGPFVEAQKNISLHFRGSENQRILMARQSLEAGELVFWEDVPYGTQPEESCQN